jgi:hypothetical protein
MTKYMKMRKALADILELAKINRDFANIPEERQRWETIVWMTGEALDHPNMAQVDRWRSNK